MANGATQKNQQTTIHQHINNMKKQIVSLLSWLVIGVNLQAQDMQVQGPVSIKFYRSVLPREDASGSAQGSAWSTASSNWMNVIRTEVASIGDGTHAVAKVIDYNDYYGMVTTPSFGSWRAVASSSTPIEYGNREYYGFKVYTQSGSFIPSNITYHIGTYVWNGTSWVNVIYPISTTIAAMNLDGNNFRQRLNAGNDGVYGTADDIVASSQLSSSPTNAFIYGGYGIGIGAYGSGTNQDKINNALAYMSGGKLKTVVTVTVLHNGTTYSFTNTTMPPSQMVQLAYVPKSSNSTASITWTGTGLLYQYEKSPDLQNWTADNSYISGSGPMSIDVAEQGLGFKKYFYRLRAW